MDFSAYLQFVIAEYDAKQRDRYTLTDLHQAAILTLLQAMKRKKTDVREAMAKALGNIDAETAIPYPDKLSEEPNHRA